MCHEKFYLLSLVTFRIKLKTRIFPVVMKKKSEKYSYPLSEGDADFKGIMQRLFIYSKSARGAGYRKYGNYVYNGEKEILLPLNL